MGDLGWNQSEMKLGALYMAIGQKEADVGAANRDYPEMEIRQADFEATSQGYPEMKMGALQA